MKLFSFQIFQILGCQNEKKINYSIFIWLIQVIQIPSKCVCPAYGGFLFSSHFSPKLLYSDRFVDCLLYYWRDIIRRIKFAEFPHNTSRMDAVEAAELGNRRRLDSAANPLLGNDPSGKLKGQKSGGKTVLCGILAIGGTLLFACTLLFWSGTHKHVVLDKAWKYVTTQKSATGYRCASCTDLVIKEGLDYVNFERNKNSAGCAQLTVICGLECGKQEASESILQWYNGDQDMGVTFMDQEGQTQVRRTLECNANGQYELEENGHKGVVTTISCIVARYHMDL